MFFQKFIEFFCLAGGAQTRPDAYASLQVSADCVFTQDDGPPLGKRMKNRKIWVAGEKNGIYVPFQGAH
ncbi:hypothetical protein [Stappia sp. ES.058]|uniref:hypothetical protein n=1 Tax=Stappia sp. ES.058 TaxID=1881061 RepID=UPI0012FE046A|nr:hypothetical protein [Stappia sp. ES.058]